MFDFGLGWSELLVIAVVAILVIGPKDLPGALRTFGRYMGTMRRMAGDFRGQFEQALREAELTEIRDQVKETINDIKKSNPLTDAEKAVSESFKSIKEIPATIEKQGTFAAAPVSSVPVPPPAAVPPPVPEPSIADVPKRA